MLRRNVLNAVSDNEHRPSLALPPRTLFTAVVLSMNQRYQAFSTFSDPAHENLAFIVLLCPSELLRMLTSHIQTITGFHPNTEPIPYAVLDANADINIFCAKCGADAALKLDAPLGRFSDVSFLISVLYYMHSEGLMEERRLRGNFLEYIFHPANEDGPETPKVPRSKFAKEMTGMDETRLS
ncbi:hypothetical protein EDB81DRAFT_807365 [Dactylonectria macrodidyma]|uniref:Uncharacterized protein n=1 Tax=Dactylonectria macrodidyma TaxID=307937 RepID=A0A9P9E8F2_9HYPO|nr:hypothetical protein EDB81DRAFT_807365 [Dactylonectria macrodidyma]